MGVVGGKGEGGRQGHLFYRKISYLYNNPMLPEIVEPGKELNSYIKEKRCIPYI